MISINIQNNIVALKDIEQEQLSYVLDWYNREDFRFATGLEAPVDLDALEQKLLKCARSSCEFFVGIHGFYEQKLMGVIHGKLSGKALWINMMAIGREFQGKGYGTVSMDLLLKYMRQDGNIKAVYLAVAEKNLKGRRFWLRNGFCDMRLASERTVFEGEKHNIIIMQKRI